MADEHYFLTRLGMTESTLVLAYYMYREQGNTLPIDSLKHFAHVWLGNTGFYDSNNNIDLNNKEFSVGFFKYLDKVLQSLIEASDIIFIPHWFPCFHGVHEGFHEYIGKNISNKSNDFLYDVMKNRRLLIVSPFSPLMADQITSGNCKRIYPNFPDIESVITYKPPYTFLNKGPDDHFLTTVDRMTEEISKLDFEVMIISCGAYTALVGHNI